MSEKKDHGALYRGKPLQSWASKTPYNMIARMLENSVMRLSKHGFLYIQGFSPAMDGVVAVHYQKKKRKPIQPARFILKRSGYDNPNENWTFASIIELERVLVPPCGDMKWVQKLSQLSCRVLKDSIRYHIHQTPMRDDAEMLKEAKAMIFHCDPATEANSPIRFLLPSDSRDVVYATVSACVTKRNVTLTERQDQLLTTMFQALDQLENKPSDENPIDQDNRFDTYLHHTTRSIA
jgi:hypothetical protein